MVRDNCKDREKENREEGETVDAKYFMIRAMHY